LIRRAREEVDTMPRLFDVIGVPSSMGAFAPGQERAPAALRAAGLTKRLAAAGLEVEDTGDAQVRRWFPDRHHPHAQHVEAVAQVAAETAGRVRESAERGHLPLVLGGDCTVGLGTIAGLRDGAPLGFVYFDLHTDMNVPASVKEGALDWMGMAHALGFEGTDERLRAFGPRTPLLDPDEVVFFAIGTDNPTPFEREQQAARGLREIDASAVIADPEGSATNALAMLEAADRILIHFDVDVVDFMDLPLSENAGRNEGLTFDTAMRALGTLAETPKLAALTVTELNPDHDPDGTAVERFVDGLADALSRAATLTADAR
jgi:arginase